MCSQLSHQNLFYMCIFISIIDIIIIIIYMEKNKKKIENLDFAINNLYRNVVKHLNQFN